MSRDKRIFLSLQFSLLPFHVQRLLFKCTQYVRGVFFSYYALLRGIPLINYCKQKTRKKHQNHFHFVDIFVEIGFRRMLCVLCIYFFAFPFIQTIFFCAECEGNNNKIRVLSLAKGTCSHFISRCFICVSPVCAVKMGILLYVVCTETNMDHNANMEMMAENEIRRCVIVKLDLAADLQM